jgi:hypothetical protein
MKRLLNKQKRALYIIDDGTDDPYISTERELDQDLKSVFKLFADTAENDLLSDDENSPSNWRNHLNDVLNDEFPDRNDDWWIKVYLLDDEIVDSWNAYVQDDGFDEDMVDIDRSSTIRNALWSRKHRGLIEFIEKYNGYEKAYYIPEEVVSYPRIKRLL